MVNTIKPYRIFAAFNPAVLKFTKQAGDDDLQEIEILHSDGTHDVFLLKVNREFYNDTLSIDISKFASGFFEQKITEINSRVHTEEFLAKNINLIYKPVLPQNILSFTAVNCVFQFGKNVNLELKQGTFLTGRTLLNKYAGYPLDVSVLGFKNVDNEEGSLTIAGIDDQEDFTIYKDHFLISIEDGDSSVMISNKTRFDELVDTEYINITDAFNNIIYVYNTGNGYEKRLIHVVNTCLPKNPFYLRWLNDRGGYEYQMFSYRQIETTQTENETSYLKYYEDSGVTYNPKRVLNMDAVKSISFGVSNINDVEFNVLNGLLTSPRKEYFDLDSQSWIELYNGDSLESSKDNHDVKHTFEATLYYAPILTQL